MIILYFTVKITYRGYILHIILALFFEIQYCIVLKMSETFSYNQFYVKDNSHLVTLMEFGHQSNTIYYIPYVDSLFVMT
jgi:hypothetical protein